MKKFYITKDSRNKSLIQALLEIFMQVIIYTYLLIAISLIIFSLPLVLANIINGNHIDSLKLYGYIVFVFITIFLALIMIRKYGVETFWKAMVRYDVFYKGKSGKYYKWFVIFIILFILISLLVAYLQYLFGK